MPVIKSINPKALPPLALRVRNVEGANEPVVGGLRLAANARLREARVLLHGFHYHGAAYMAGYAAEIGLGYCWARATGADHRASAESLVRPARRRAQALVEQGLLDLRMATDFRQGHSPLFWWRLYAYERELAGRPVPFASHARIESLVDFLQQAWEVWLRYAPNLAGPADAEEIVYRTDLLLQETYKIQR